MKHFTLLGTLVLSFVFQGHANAAVPIQFGTMTATGDAGTGWNFTLGGGVSGNQAGHSSTTDGSPDGKSFWAGKGYGGTGTSNGDLITAGNYRIDFKYANTVASGAVLSVKAYGMTGVTRTLLGSTTLAAAQWVSGNLSFTVLAGADVIGRQLQLEFSNVGAAGSWVGWDTLIGTLYDIGSGPAELEASFGSVDTRYLSNFKPSTGGAVTFSGTAWRGERYNSQLVLWANRAVSNLSLTCTALTHGSGASFAIQPRFVISSIADDGGAGCGNNLSRPVTLQPDAIDTDTSPITISSNNAQPVWVTADVPASAPVGTYQGTITVSGTGLTPIDLTFNIEVLDLVLPDPSAWAFHLDLWQSPWSIARYHGLAVWSQAHKDAISEQLNMLAKAGQKVITTTIVHSAWGGQTYDDYESLVEWTKHADGSWSYDFSRFDDYVKLADAAGITRQINCYSMIAWGNQYRYYNEATSAYVTATLTPGTQAYTDHWTPFLKAFRVHLYQKGWMHRTAIAMDERGESVMRAAIDLVKQVAPELKIATAGHYYASLDPDVYDWSVYGAAITDAVRTVAQNRKATGRKSTFYGACDIASPNMFTYSPPVQIAWHGWYAAAAGFDGTLRWAYNSWVEDPLTDTRHSAYPAGDTFLVYPGPRTSIRFESLRDGIEEYEKVRILGRVLTGQNWIDLQNVLAGLNVGFAASGAAAGTLVPQARLSITALARTAVAQPVDSSPPSPSPMSWSVLPHATSTTTLSMTATTETDASGVEYYFTCLSGGGNDSGWQDSAVYVDTGLLSGGSYAYSVAARDKSLNQNTTASSAIASATTNAGGTGNPFTDTDADSLDDSWESAQYGNITAHAASEDPDHDGFTVLCEMAFGGSTTSPGPSDVATRISTDADGSSVQFSHRRSKNYNALRLRYQLQTSETLGAASWADDPSPIRSIVDDPDGITEWVTYTLTRSSATTHQFYRCHATAMGAP